MPVIIGAGTTVESPQFVNGGVVSVQFGFEPQVERLYQLGSFTPYDSSLTTTRTMSVNVYGSKPNGTGGSVPLSVAPSDSCVDIESTLINVNPASCVASILPSVGSYFLTSYSYSKDNLGYGQETWSFTSKPTVEGYAGTIVTLRGIAEGTIIYGDGTMLPEYQGVTIDTAASNDSNSDPILGESGNVTAGPVGVGSYDIQRYIIATSVGGSRGRHADIDGQVGNASVNIPLTTVFL